VLHTADDDFAFASEHTDVLQPIAEIAFELLQFGDQAAAP
jgi:hypothetical protein